MHTIEPTTLEVVIFDILANSILSNLKDSSTSSMTFSTSKGYLLVGNARGNVSAWHFESSEQKLIEHMRFGSESKIISLATSQDGVLVAAGSEAGEIQIWDSSTGRSVATLTADPDGPVYHLAFTDNRRLVADCGDGHALPEWTFSEVLDHNLQRTSVDRATQRKELQGLSLVGAGNRPTEETPVKNQSSKDQTSKNQSTAGAPQSSEAKLAALRDDNLFFAQSPFAISRDCKWALGRHGTTVRYFNALSADVMDNASAGHVTKLWDIGTTRPLFTLERQTIEDQNHAGTTDLSINTSDLC